MSNLEKFEISNRENEITRRMLKELMKEVHNDRGEAILCLRYALTVLGITTDK